MEKELMNIKLSIAVSDINGVSGMGIIRAIVNGERSPKVLASLRNKMCRQPEEVFIAALTGNYQEEHLFSLQQAVESYDFAMKQLKDCDDRILAELET
jgi:transposase